MNTKRPEAQRIADDLHHSITHYGAEDAFTFAAYEAGQRVRALHAENESLRAGYDAARLEIASLRERVQQLGQLARDVNSRRVVELEAQLAAVGAGGVEPLRKRECLHQITEPDHFRGAAKLIAAARQALEARLPTSKHSQALWHRQQPALAAIREALEAEPQPAAQASECGNCFEGETDRGHACRKCGGTGVAQPAAQALDALSAVKV